MNHSSHYNPQHRHILRLLFALVLSCVVVPSMAQVGEEAALKMSDVDMDSPTFRPTVHTGKALVDGDSVQYMETLPNDQARKEHMKLVEKEIKATYGPRMKKLTYSQGKLLIKLIDRETHSSGYELINAFLGPVRAGFYQAFAWVFGASLKKRYDPMGADRLTERIVLQVEAGQL